MKPLWTQTLAWIVAIIIAVLFAFASPDTPPHDSPFGVIPHGSQTPR